MGGLPGAQLIGPHCRPSGRHNPALCSARTMTMRHKTKWTVKYLRTGVRVLFDSEESARTLCFDCAGVIPVALYAPLYR